MADPLLSTPSRIAFPDLGIAVLPLAAQRRNLSFTASRSFAYCQRCAQAGQSAVNFGHPTG